MMTQENRDWLEEALRGPSSIRDEGFTERVLLALPPRRRSARLRPAILLGAATVSGGTSLLLLPGGRYLDQAALALLTRGPMSPVLLLGALTIVMLLGALAAASAE